MIDPSHGGDDHGAILAGKVEEKNVTLNLARELRRQLEERGLHAKLLRESDANLSLERRAETTNQEHAGLYVALHVGPPGKGVRVYLPALPSSSTLAVPGFLAWDSAQTSALERSRMVARAVSAELRKTDLPVNQLTAPLRPLNNLTVPAIALEWAPEAGDLKPQESSRVSAKMTAAVATAVAQVRGALEPRP